MAQRSVLPNSMYDAPYRALAAIQNKCSEPFPKDLRQALGRSMVEASYYELENWDPRMEVFKEPPVLPAPGKGTPGTAQPRQEFQAPWQLKTGLRQRLAYSKRLVQRRPTEVWAEVVQMLDLPVAVQALSYDLVQAVEKQDLLAGYSALASAGACLYFASYSLETPIGYSYQELGEVGLSFHGSRCAYNALWCQRDELADMIQQRGGSLAMLRPPIAPDRGVLKRMVKEDAEQRKAYADEAKVNSGGKRAAWKRVWAWAQGKSSSKGKRFLPESEQTMCG